jgi:hypothetical protein
MVELSLGYDLCGSARPCSCQANGYWDEHAAVATETSHGVLSPVSDWHVDLPGLLP